MTLRGRNPLRALAMFATVLAVSTLPGPPAAAFNPKPPLDPCERPNPPRSCTAHDPTGQLVRVVRTSAGLLVEGTATDPDTPSPVQVDVEVDGRFLGSLAAGGPGGSFSGTVTATAGTRFCAWARNQGPGADTRLGCQDVIVRVDPIGHVDEVKVTSTGLLVRGWAIDPDTADPITVQLVVDGSPRQEVSALLDRPDVEALHPGYGKGHGFEITLPGARRHTSVCPVGVNVGPGVNATLGCARDRRTVSILDLNIQGTQEEYVNPVAFGTTTIPWRDRYRRIPQWLASTGTLPDLIALQELPLRKQRIGYTDPYDYEALFLLIEELTKLTGARYRIAYASADRVGEGLLPLHQGRALIYNADRLRNSTTLVNSWAVGPDDATTVGVHMSTSLPCHPPVGPERCDLIDSTSTSDREGRHWVSSFVDPQTGKWHRGPAGAVFELRDEPGKHVVAINVHVADRCAEPEPKSPLCIAGERAEMLALRALVDGLSTRWAAHAKLVPPIVAGDFNGDVNMPTASGIGYEPTLPDFDVALADDVDFVLVGKPQTYPSAYPPAWESQAYPGRVTFLGLPKPPYCGTPATVLADHCALFAQVLPFAATPTSPPPTPPTPPPGSSEAPSPGPAVCTHKPWLVGC